MLKHLLAIITDFDCIPKRLLSIVSQYILFLMLDHKKHELRTASKTFGTHESNFSRLLSNKKTRQLSRQCLNRSIRRRIAKIKSSDQIYIIIDATNIGRTSKNVQNCSQFRQGHKYFKGHKFTNIVLLINEEVVPLAAIPFYSRSYCKKIGIDYQTEIEMISQWIEELPNSGLLPSSIIGKLHFLLDSGYDAKDVQNTIATIGALFTVSLRSSRIVNGLGVREYFQRHRHIPWKTIRLRLGNSCGNLRKRKFRIRSAVQSHLKGFGKTVVVCSEKVSRSARKVSRKYLATNNLKQSARRTIEIYGKRWTIETWHKEMKQKYGYGDCRSQKFCAIETHINFSLCAYCLAGMACIHLPKKGTTIEQYRICEEWKRASRVINQFNGKIKLKTLAYEEIAKITNE